MSIDWLPGTRVDILAMCQKWLTYLIEALRIALRIPATEFTEQGNLFNAVETLLTKVRDEAERTHVIRVECQATFKALTAKMRFFRDRYFKIPPLTEGDWADLGFKVKDPHPTPTPAPDGVPAVSLSYPGGPHAMTIHLLGHSHVRRVFHVLESGKRTMVTHGCQPSFLMSSERRITHFIINFPAGTGRALMS